MKNKLLLALLSISLLFGNENYIKVNASSSIDVINEEIISNNNEQVNLLADDSLLEYYNASYNNESSSIIFDGESIPSVYTTNNAIDGDSNISIDFKMISGNQPIWSFIVSFYDTSVGTAPWAKKDANSKETYYLQFGPDDILLNKVTTTCEIKNLQKISINDTANFYQSAHSLKIYTKKIEESLKIQALLDDELFISTLDDNPIKQEGGISIFTHGKSTSGETSKYEITSFKANLKKTSSNYQLVAVDDTLLNVEGNLVDIIENRHAYVVGTYTKYEESEKSIVFQDTATPSLYSTPDAKTLDTHIEFDYELKEGSLKNWQAMVFFRDQNPGVAAWARNSMSANSESYLLQIYPEYIDVAYVDKSLNNATVDGFSGFKNTSFDKSFWNEKHHFEIYAKDIDNKVKIQVLIDDVLVISAYDDNNRITAKGGFTMFTHGRNEADKQYSKFAISNLMINFPEVHAFGEGLTEYDFKDFVSDPNNIQGSCRDTGAKSYIGPNYFEMDKPEIRGAYFENEVLDDFILNYKLKTTWLASKEWGSILTFRNETPNKLPWDTGRGRCYGIMQGYNVYDETTNIIIWKYSISENGRPITEQLCTVTGLNDNEKECTYRLICKTVDEGVRIVLYRDGEIFIDCVDSNNPITNAGKISLVAGSGTTVLISGINEGIDRLVITIGGKTGTTGNSNYDPIERIPYEYDIIKNLTKINELDGKNGCSGNINNITAIICSLIALLILKRRILK